MFTRSYSYISHSLCLKVVLSLNSITWRLDSTAMILDACYCSAYAVQLFTWPLSSAWGEEIWRVVGVEILGAVGSLNSRLCMNYPTAPLMYYLRYWTLPNVWRTLFLAATSKKLNCTTRQCPLHCYMCRHPTPATEKYFLGAVVLRRACAQRNLLTSLPVPRELRRHR
jgi:hypothetical protein